MYLWLICPKDCVKMSSFWKVKAWIFVFPSMHIKENMQCIIVDSQSSKMWNRKIRWTVSTDLCVSVSLWNIILSSLPPSLPPLFLSEIYFKHNYWKCSLKGKGEVSLAALTWIVQRTCLRIFSTFWFLELKTIKKRSESFSPFLMHG